MYDPCFVTESMAKYGSVDPFSYCSEEACGAVPRILCIRDAIHLCSMALTISANNPDALTHPIDDKNFENHEI